MSSVQLQIKERKRFWLRVTFLRLTTPRCGQKRVWITDESGKQACATSDGESPPLIHIAVNLKLISISVASTCEPPQVRSGARKTPLHRWQRLAPPSRRQEYQSSETRAVNYADVGRRVWARDPSKTRPSSGRRGARRVTLPTSPPPADRTADHRSAVGCYRTAATTWSRRRPCTVRCRCYGPCCNSTADRRTSEIRALERHGRPPRTGRCCRSAWRTTLCCDVPVRRSGAVTRPARRCQARWRPRTTRPRTSQRSFRWAGKRHRRTAGWWQVVGDRSEPDDDDAVVASFEHVTKATRQRFGRTSRHACDWNRVREDRKRRVKPMIDGHQE
jgi:hypothetical protein